LLADVCCSESPNVRHLLTIRKDPWLPRQLEGNCSSETLVEAKV
jgi:hypothetical protein